MMPFGCKVIVQMPASQRKGKKSLDQERAWLGFFSGYGEQTGYGGAYRVYHLKDKMVKTVSMNFCVIDEGNFPCKMEKDMIKEKHVLPIDSQMTKDALLDPIGDMDFHPLRLSKLQRVYQIAQHMRRYGAR